MNAILSRLINIRFIREHHAQMDAGSHSCALASSCCDSKKYGIPSDFMYGMSGAGSKPGKLGFMVTAARVNLQ